MFSAPGQPHAAPFLAVVLIGLTSLTVSGQEPRLIKLPATYVDFAFNPELGDVAAIDSKNHTAHVFRKAYIDGRIQDVPSPVKVGNHPVSICYKDFKHHGLYAIVCLRDAHLYLIDAKKFTLLHKIPLGHSGISLVASSLDPADPYLYYCYGDGHDSATGRVNLSKLTDEGEVFGDSADMAVSASGKLFYRRGPWSPSGFECLRMLESGDKDSQYVRVYYDHTSTSAYLPDRSDTYTAAGADIFTADLKRKLATLDFPAMCFFPGKPWILGLKDGDLVAASYNTFHTAGRVSLPWPSPKELDERQQAFAPKEWKYFDVKSNGFRARVFGDANSDRVIAAGYDRLVITPLAALNLPDEPVLQVRVDGSTQLLVDQPGRIAFAKADERLETELVNPPEGVAIDGGAITWTPAGDQVGSHALQLSLKHGDLEVLQTVDVNVARPFAKLPLEANLVAIDSAAKRAVCASIHPGNHFGNPGPASSDQPANTTRLAVVDLESLQVIGQTRLPFVASAVEVDDERIYIASASASSLTVISLDALARPRQISTDEPVVGVQPVAGKHLIATLQSGQMNRFSLPDLKRTGILSPARGMGLYADMIPPHADGRPHSAIVRMGDGWLLGGLYYDDALSKIRLIQQPEGILAIQGPGGQLVGRAGELHEWSDNWPGNPNVHSRQRIGTAYGVVTLDSVPVRVTADVQRRQEDVATHTWRTLETIRLTAYNRESDAVQEHILLAKLEVPDEHHGGGRDWYTAQSPLLKGAVKTVVFAHRDRLFRYEFDDVDPEKFPPPLAIKPEQSVRVINREEETRLAHTIENARQPVQAALIDSRPEVQIDAATAEVSIDGPALIASLQKRLVGEGDPHGAAPSFRDVIGHVPYGSSDWQSLSAYKTESAPKFEKLAGRKPEGLPLAVPVHLRVIDADSKTAELRYYVLVDVPAEPIEKRLAERDAERDTQIKEMQQRAAAEREVTLAGGARSSNTAGTDRLRQLEQRVKALEDKLDLLTRLLGQQLGRPPEPNP